MNNVFNIFLDSNIYIKSKYHFSSGHYETLKKYCKLGIVKLISCEIVNHEVERNIKSDLEDTCNSLRKVFRKNQFNKELSDLEGYDFLLRDFKKDNWSNHIINKFHDYLNSVDAISLDYSAIDPKTLFNDYFNLIPPFEKKETKKHEFPDAAIILSLKNFISNGTPLIIVTDDDIWKESFVSYDNVVIFDDFKKALLHITKCVVNSEEIKCYFDFIIQSNQQIYQRVSDYLFNLYWEDYLDDSYCVEILDVTDCSINDIKIEFQGFDYVDNEYATANFIAKIEAIITYCYNDYTSAIYDKEDEVYYGIRYCEVKELHKFELEFNAFIENGEKELYFSDFEFEYFELSNFSCIKTLSEFSTDEDPYY